MTFSLISDFEVQLHIKSATKLGTELDADMYEKICNATVKLEKKKKSHQFLVCVNVEIHDCRMFLFKSVKALALSFQVLMFCRTELVVACTI